MPDPTDPFTPADEPTTAIRRKDASPVDVIDTCLERMDELLTCLERMDELLMVLEGSAEVEILGDHDSPLMPLTERRFTVVPRAMSHHQCTKQRDLVELFAMPGSNEESAPDRPRPEASPVEAAEVAGA